MAYGLATVPQDSFGGGIFRGRRAPADSVYDAINALVSDERELFERGGSAFKSTVNAASTLRAIADSVLPVGQRTLLFTDSSLLVLGTDDQTPVVLASGAGVWTPPLGRVVAGPGVLAYVRADGQLVRYAGTRKPVYSTGVVSVTNGSRTILGGGTAWLANADAGMVFVCAGTPGIIVEKVNSDTNLTLRNPWPGGTGVGLPYSLSTHITGLPIGALPSAGAPVSVATAGTRLVYCVNERAYLSPPGDPFTFDADTYHEIPTGEVIVGAAGAGATLVLFATDGVWTIANMDLDIFDAQGNVQQSVQQINKDLILWDDSGVAAWAGGLLVPAVDDVFVLGLDGSASPVSEGIRPLYRSYVKAGHRPGMAAVHRGHYFLPILDASSNVVDVLVCRLDLTDSRGGRRPAWTRWAGHAAGPAVAQRVGGQTRQPKLLGVSGLRVTDLSGCLDVPGATVEADGSARTFEVVTSDLATGPGARGQTCRKFRIRYELAGASASVAASVARGTEGAAFTALTSPGDAGVSDGTKPATWKANAKAPALRFRLRSTSANTKLILRSVEMHLRQTAKA